jgi:hypothetical protein
MSLTSKTKDKHPGCKSFSALYLLAVLAAFSSIWILQTLSTEGSLELLGEVVWDIVTAGATFGLALSIFIFGAGLMDRYRIQSISERLSKSWIMTASVGLLALGAGVINEIHYNLAGGAAAIWWYTGVNWTLMPIGVIVLLNAAPSRTPEAKAQREAKEREFMEKYDREYGKREAQEARNKPVRPIKAEWNDRDWYVLVALGVDPSSVPEINSPIPAKEKVDENPAR